MSSPTVSIIFCHHTGDFIYEAVESAINQRSVQAEVIVATSIAGISIPGAVRTIHVPGSPARKRNVASLWARGKYLAFYDDDTTLDVDSVRQQLYVCRQSTVGMTFGKLLKMDDPTMFDEAGGFLTWTGFIWARADRCRDIGQFEKTEPIFAGKSAACMIKKRLFRRLGGFDTEMGILGEESDLAWRVWLFGYSVQYVPKSRTCHAFGTKLKPVERHYTDRRVFLNGPRNYLLMHLRCSPVHRLPLTVLLQLAAWTVAAFGQLLRGRWRAFLLILQGIAYPFWHLRGVLRSRARVQALRRVPHRYTTPYIYRSIAFSYFTSRLLHYIKTGLHGS